MSARRSRRTAAAVVVLAATAAALVPAAANAATPAASSAAARPALTMRVVDRSSDAALRPGGASESFVIEVTNTTAKPQPFNAGIGELAQGELMFDNRQMRTTVTALGRTEATASSFINEQPGIMGTLWPKGKPLGTDFTIPAHTTFSWKVAVEATKSWVANNNGVTAEVFGYQPNQDRQFGDINVNFKVGAHKTGGPVVETLSGTNTVRPDRPAYETLTVTNRTGAAIAAPWTDGVFLDGLDTFNTDVWVGTAAKGHWQRMVNGILPAIPGGFANGATATYHFRVDLARYVGNAPTQHVYMMVWSNNTSEGPGNAVSTTLTVYRQA
jgi:hypothetical protein